MDTRGEYSGGLASGVAACGAWAGRSSQGESAVLHELVTI